VGGVGGVRGVGGVGGVFVPSNTYTRFTFTLEVCSNLEQSLLVFRACVIIHKSFKRLISQGHL
jgi:hypothetical protein